MRYGRAREREKTGPERSHIEKEKKQNIGEGKEEQANTRTYGTGTVSILFCRFSCFCVVTYNRLLSSSFFSFLIIINCICVQISSSSIVYLTKKRNTQRSNVRQILRRSSSFFFVGLLPFEMFDEDERIHFLMMSISVVLRKMNLLVDEYQG